MEKVFTTDQAAKFLGVSRVRVRQFIQERRFKATKLGRDYLIAVSELEKFSQVGRRPTGRPCKNALVGAAAKPDQRQLAEFTTQTRNGVIHHGDVLKVLAGYADQQFQTIIADPPYFQVLTEHSWDNHWHSQREYLEWTRRWVRACRRVLQKDGLLYVFGQPGKREHLWLHTCSLLATEMQFHDLIIWDRVVGYNERADSFTPQYEMILALRHPECAKPYFNKSVVRIPYDEQTIKRYLRDTRYKNRQARIEHLKRGKYATNILRIPSLKGSSREKVGHPSQKPVALIEMLVNSSSQRGQMVLDPFLGSGTTAMACENLGRKWVGIERNAEYVVIAGKRIKQLHKM